MIEVGFGYWAKRCTSQRSSYIQAFCGSFAFLIHKADFEVGIQKNSWLVCLYGSLLLLPYVTCSDIELRNAGRALTVVYCDGRIIIVRVFDLRIRQGSGAVTYRSCA